MKPARLIVLGVALVAGGVAAYLASGSRQTVAPKAEPPPPPMATVDVLIAKTDLDTGQVVAANDIGWQTWPAASTGANFVKKSDRPDAIKDFVGAVVRSPVLAGEPIRDSKVVAANGGGFMAAILPQGMRAVSTEISPETGAGGFILPNDRVDVILTRREKNPDPKVSGDLIIPMILLSNIRVLAIDQAPKEKDGQNSVVGKTVTLELKPEQTALLAGARQAGTLSLALRSIADVNQVEIAIDDRTRVTGSINVVRYGINNPTAIQK